MCSYSFLEQRGQRGEGREQNQQRPDQGSQEPQQGGGERPQQGPARRKRQEETPEAPETPEKISLVEVMTMARDVVEICKGVFGVSFDRCNIFPKYLNTTTHYHSYQKI